MEVQRNVTQYGEEEIVKVFELTKQLVPETDNCVYMGGVGFELCSKLNYSVTITLNLWILPNQILVVH